MQTTRIYIIAQDHSTVALLLGIPDDVLSSAIHLMKKNMKILIENKVHNWAGQEFFDETPNKIFDLMQ